MGEAELADPASLAKAIAELEKQMRAATERLQLEETAELRDRVEELRAQQICKTRRTKSRHHVLWAANGLAPRPRSG